MKQTLCILSLFLASLSAKTCDATKAIAPIYFTLQPRASDSITWDFTDCGFGITADSFYISQNGKPNGFNKNAPLTVTLYDQTLNEYIPGQFDFYCIENCGNVAGHVLVMVLTNIGSKPLNIQIQQTANWGGLP